MTLFCKLQGFHKEEILRYIRYLMFKIYFYIHIYKLIYLSCDEVKFCITICSYLYISVFYLRRLGVDWYVLKIVSQIHMMVENAWFFYINIWSYFLNFTPYVFLVNRSNFKKDICKVIWLLNKWYSRILSTVLPICELFIQKIDLNLLIATLLYIW